MSPPEATARASDSRPAPGAPSWQRILCGLGLAGLLLACFFRFVLLSDLRTHDGFWHLASGRVIAEAGAVPRVDPFCFSTGGLDWINLNWLAQLLAYWSFEAWGFAGPLTGAACLFALGLAACGENLRRRGVLSLPALVALGACFFVLWLPFGIRPRTASFALFPALAALLAIPDPEDRLSGGRAGGILALLLLWNQLHGGFVYGYGLVGFDLVGTTLAARWAGRGWITRRALLLAGCIALGLAGFVLHPHGFAALHHALTYPARFEPAFFELILELQPLALRGPLGLFVEGYLAWGVLGVALAPRHLRLRDLLPTLVFLHLAFAVRRGVIPWVLVSAPVFAEQWSHVLRERAGARRWLARGLEARLATAWRGFPAVLAAALLPWVLVIAPNRTPGERPGQVRSPAVDPQEHPVAAIEALQASGVPGRIFNAYGAGGLLLWAVHPQPRAFIDGRGDLHTRGENYASYLRIVGLEPGWDEALAALDVELVLMPARAPLTYALRSRGWGVLHEDPAWLVLRAP